MITTKLSVPVANGWEFTEFYVSTTHTVIGRIILSKDSQEWSLRIDLGKMAIIDVLPDGLTITHEFLMEHVLPPVSEVMKKAMIEEWNSQGAER